MVLVSISVCLLFLSVGLRPILNLKQFNHNLHIPSFKMPTIRHVWWLVQHGDYAFSIELQDDYLHMPIVKHPCHFLPYVWHNVHILPVEGFAFWAGHSPLGFHSPH